MPWRFCEWLKHEQWPPAGATNLGFVAVCSKPRAYGGTGTALICISRFVPHCTLPEMMEF